MYDIKLDEVTDIIYDFDETLAMSINSFEYAYRELFNSSGDFPLLGNVRRWNMEDIYPNITPKIVESVFQSDVFFDILRPYDSMVESMKYFKSKGKRITILSLGSMLNIHNKSKFIKENFDGLYDYFLFGGSDDDLVMDKSLFNFKQKNRVSVMIDDSKSNLDSMKDCVDYRILAKLYTNEETEWNRGWQGLSIRNGNELVNIFR